MVILAYTFQLERLRNRISTFVARGFILLTESVSTSEAGDDSKGATEQVADSLPVAVKFGMRCSYFVVITLVGFVLVRYLPFSIPRQNGLLRDSLSNGEIWPGIAILIFGVGVYLVMREVFWRQATPAQASMFLRGTYLREHHREFSSIVWRGIKLRRRELKKSRKEKRKKQKQK